MGFLTAPQREWDRGGGRTGQSGRGAIRLIYGAMGTGDAQIAQKSAANMVKPTQSSFMENALSVSRRKFSPETRVYPVAARGLRAYVTLLLRRTSASGCSCTK